MLWFLAGSYLYEFSYIRDRVMDCLNRFFMISTHNTFPFFVDMMLFTIIFEVVIVDVGVLKAPSKSRKLPHTINLLPCVSALLGWISQTIRPYVTFLLQRVLLFWE